MKTKVFVAIAFMACICQYAQSQFTFSVSPGLNLNSASVGYKINEKITPFFAFQFYSIKASNTYSREYFDYDLYEVVNETSTDELSLNMFLPSLGLKYYASKKERLGTYFSASLIFPLVSGKLSFDGEEEEEFKDLLKNSSVLAFEAGYGAEYFFDEHFSIGGECGIRYIKVKATETWESSYYNPILDQEVDTERTEEYNVNVSPFFTRFYLNFYF